MLPPASAEIPRAVSPTLRLAEGLAACETVIDLRDCLLPTAELSGLYTRLLLDCPELFHVAPRLSYGYTEVTVDGTALRVVTEVYPVYRQTGETLTAARILYRDTVEGLLREMEAAFGHHIPTEAETVLFLHDLLADRYAYDTRGGGSADTSFPPGSPAEANADAHSFFRDGVGICQAYALAFLALCRGAGLEADVVVSDAMDHAWNHVRVDGIWYHVDVTRDDPIPAPGEGGTVAHTRLLRSDGGMESMGYHGFICAAGHACTDTRFEGTDGQAGLSAFTDRLRFSGGWWVGVDDCGGIVGVKLQKNGVYVGEVGDTDLNGRIEPRDLLVLADETIPESWRESLRRLLVSPPSDSEA